MALLTIGPTPAKSAAFTNAYAKALGDYINGLVSSKQQAQLQQVEHTVNNLKWEIAANGSKVPASLTSQLASAQADEQALIASPGDHWVPGHKAGYRKCGASKGRWQEAAERHRAKRCVCSEGS